MNLEDFLYKFIASLNESKCKYCILRNYEGLPRRLNSRDIDFLIKPDDLIKIKTILQNIKGIRITGYIARSYLSEFYVEGVSYNNKKAIELDFFLQLSWKGISYLSTKSVLDNSKNSLNNNLVKIPSEIHEAINSFFSSYMVGGWIKEKYQPLVKKIFSGNKSSVISELSSFFGVENISEMVKAVTEDDKNQLIKILPKLRRKLLLRSLLTKPLQTIKAIFKHYYYESIIRFTPYYLDAVCILGPDGSGKSSVLEKVVPKLTNTTKVIETMHLKPKFFFRARSSYVGPVTNPHAKPPRSMFTSSLKFFIWLLEGLIDRHFHHRKSLTLRIYDRYYHDLLVDPRRYRYGGPMWLARLVGKIIPKPDLFILLDAPPEVLQSRKREVSMEETARQRKAYLDLVGGMKNGVVVDASKPLDEVVSDVNEIILDFMAERTRKRMGS